ncbi:P-loop containing nucleoside triphosphate hydrolase protein [Tothia fuscella]|uniref:RNA helicase n=1 Tax=Tothia fuscella TaxID=1048955 RepID=A0A9P4P2W5_9PEZI|nr:P-loop containing nucleoside triphosphate hydrolase protein [Tothia fuscella]
MAKKKKTAVNPARGYATASIPSKAKPEKVEEPAVIIAEETVNVQESEDGAKAKVENAKIMIQQTPEELEAQLERDELQLLVEKYSVKVRKDATRLTTKVQTDCRVLRGAATHLPLATFLPDELKMQLIDLVQKDALESGYQAHSNSWSKLLAEEETTVRCWTLFEALLGLGISQENIKSVIGALLKNPPSSDPGVYIWGFKEALDFLSLRLEESELPSYISGKTMGSMGTGGIEDDEESDSLPSPVATPKLKSTTNSTLSSPHKLDLNAQDTEDDLHASDFESDVEPENMLSIYLAIKERLYRHRPELVEKAPASKKKWKKTVPVVPPSGTLTPKVQKLTDKLRLIEADVLFDQREADYSWDSRKSLIMHDVITPKRGPQLVASQARGSERSITVGGESPETAPTSVGTPDGSDSEDEDLLGAMFSATIEEEQAPTSAPPTSDGPAVWLRDFGKVSGMSPRRVLEDACRTRNSKATLTFHLVSPTAYASRHSVNIKWTKDQETLPSDTVPYIKIQQVKSTKGPNLMTALKFTMTTIATPDPQQSEAFVATAALFYLCSPSKEDKTYMKLPAVWRDLYAEFGAARKEVIDDADRDRLKMIRSIVQEHTEREEEDGIVLASAFRGRNLDSPRSNSSRNISPTKLSLSGPSIELKALWERVSTTPNYQRMLPSRIKLPMHGFKAAALAAIDSHQVLILCGETGCGKSTQLPAYVLEHQLSQGKQCKIYCTEPRRISAISLAQRVSEELGEHTGDVGTFRSLVGYAIRLESKTTPQTRLIYATVGVVLRMLESAKGLTDITHLIIDEVHERSIDTDFLLIVLKTLMIERPELKIVLMSATVDASRFSKYLNGAPIITVPGRTFPVQTRYLEDAIELTNYIVSAPNNERNMEEDDDGTIENATSGIPKQLPGYKVETRQALANYDEYRMDYELIVNLMEKIARDPKYAKFNKATLVFLPGIAEIRELNDLLSGSPTFSQNCWVVPLHSSIASEEQQHAFLLPPKGVRKVVLATNIAETGITIPDVTCVIDTGKHKEMRYDERRQLSRLIQSFISRANAKQRRGRAGRVQEGICFHMFTKYRHDELMAEAQTPEMLRLSLQELVMRVKICGLGAVEETLSRALDPPSSKNIRRAIDALIEVGALTSMEELTPLGSQLAKIPADANLGKLVILSALFNCLDVGVTIAAILSNKSPFITPFGEKQRADTTRLAFARGNSDLLTAYNAYTSWRKVCQSGNMSPFTWCRKNYLSHQYLQNIEELKGQLLASLSDTGLISIDRRKMQQRSKGKTSFVQIPLVNDTNSFNDALTSTVIAWSFYPKLLIRDGKGWRNISNSQSVSLHPSSVNKTPTQAQQNIKLLSYYSMLQTSGSKHYNALSTTAVSELPLLLMAGDVEFRAHAGVLVLDGNRGRWKCDEWKVLMGLKVLRGRLGEYVEGRLREPRREVGMGVLRWVDLFERVMGRDVLEKERV